jgi:hypothetical protein
MNIANPQQKASWILLSAVIALSLPPVAQSRDDRLGVTTHFSQGWDLASSMTLLQSSSIGWIRDDIFWSQFETSKGVYATPANVQTWINAVSNAGIKIVGLIGYGNPIYADPYDPVAYGNFAAWLARTFAGKIQAIEVCNEPNGDYASKEGRNWQARYTSLLNATAAAVKAANPNVVVIGGGSLYTSDNYLIMSDGVSAQVDGLTAHPYCAENLPDNLKDGGQPFGDYVNAWRQNAAGHHAPNQIWHTEWGQATEKDPGGKWAITESIQAWENIRRLLDCYFYNIDHTFIYDLRDDAFTPFNAAAVYGIAYAQSPDGDRRCAPKLCFHAVNNVSGALSGLTPDPARPFTYFRPENPPPNWNWKNYSAYRFNSPAGHKTVIAFFLNDHWYNPGTFQAFIRFGTYSPRSVTLYDPVSGQSQNLPWWSDGSGLTTKVTVTSHPQFLIIE